MARLLALANPASGSGKTSAAVGIASMLVDLGQRVLAVDLDAQAHLTRAFAIDAETLSCSLFDVLVHALPVTEAMLDTDAGLDVLPATLELSGVEAFLITRSGREQLLRHALADVVDDYDWIIVDCASSLGLLTQNALAAADVVLMPVRQHSPRAEAQLLASMDEVRRFVNPALEFRGLLAIGGAGLDASVVPVSMAIPHPPMALNAYREFAKRLLAA
ncbi:MAG: ParA family protein [Candidatus Nanopelagicales bacterium]